ncbi:ribonuclease H family protein [Corynebacterium qintianiae]|nr:ribonuclease H family protein [Corynebacterium qintianiae]
MTSATKPTAVIHFLDRHLDRQRDLIVTAAVDGEVVYSNSQPVSSRFEVLSWLIEAVNETWKYQRGGMTLYIADATIRSLLTNALTNRPGLDVRSVVTGAAMRATWEAARVAQAHVVHGPAEGEVPAAKVRRVYATDASKQKRDSLIGIAAVDSTGKIQIGQVHAKTVLEGEFAAIAMVLRRLKSSKTAREVDILTDSLTAARATNSSTPRPFAGEFERSCVAELDKVRARGIDVRVSWVRGHDGNALNELADRAAVTARRCGQWGHSPTALVANIRADLRELLAAVDPHDFVPATPLPSQATAAA